MILLSIITLLLLGVTLFALKKKMVYLIFPIVIAFVIGLAFKITKGFVPVPVGVRHLIHLAIPPDDLRKPIIEDKFSFHKKDFEKTYNLTPKYLDLYDFGFKVDKDLPDNYKFTGRIKLDFVQGNRIIEEQLVDGWRARGDGWVVLSTFEMPIKGRYLKDLSVKISVLEADEQLQGLSDSLEMYIGVSAIP